MAPPVDAAAASIVTAGRSSGLLVVMRNRKVLSQCKRHAMNAARPYSDVARSGSHAGSHVAEV